MLQRPVKGDTLEVRSGDRLEGFEIRINPPESHAITGRVLDAAGKPIRGVYVMSSLPHGPSWWSRTDAAGAFHLQGLDGMGQPSVPVCFLYIPGISGQIVIPGVPVNTKGVELVLPTRGTISAAVRHAGSDVVVQRYDIKVTAVTLAGSGAVWAGPHGKVERHPDHSVTISDIPTGQADVEVRVEGLGVQRVSTQVEGGKSTPLAVTMPAPEQEKR